MYQTNINVNLMVETVIQIKSEITINVGTNKKKHSKTNIFGILLYVVAKMVSI